MIKKNTHSQVFFCLVLEEEGPVRASVFSRCVFLCMRHITPAERGHSGWLSKLSKGRSSVRLGYEVNVRRGQGMRYSTQRPHNDTNTNVCVRNLHSTEQHHINY